MARPWHRETKKSSRKRRNFSYTIQRAAERIKEDRTVLTFDRKQNVAPSQLLLFLLLFLPVLGLSTSSFAATELNLAILRYRPTDKKQTLSPVRPNIAPAKLKTEKSQAILTALRAHGEAELLYQTTGRISEGKTNHIEKSDLATVVLPGETTALPPITRLSVNFDIQYEPASSTLAWNGAVIWSPQLVDRAALTLITRSKTNLTLLRPFAPAGQTTGFEYPVLKQTTFQSSKIARDGELIVTTTAAEAGATPPEILILCLWKFTSD